MPTGEGSSLERGNAGKDRGNANSRGGDPRLLVLTCVPKWSVSQMMSGLRRHRDDSFGRETPTLFQTAWQQVLFPSTPRREPSAPASGSPEGSGSNRSLQEAALQLPVEDGGEPQQVVHLEGVAATHRPRQKQDRFLNV